MKRYRYLHALLFAPTLSFLTLVFALLCLSHRPLLVQAADPVDDNVTTAFNTPATMSVLSNDSDNNLDVVFSNRFHRNQVCFGDGAGSFSCRDVSTAISGSIRLDIGDVNNDLRPDLVFANYNGQRNTLCLGDGINSFACNDLSTDTNESIRPALGDVNRDNKQDVVFANFDNQRNRVCLGDGTGSFVCSDVSTDTHASSSVALGLVNGDNNLDVVFANGDAFVTFTGQRDRVCLGDGTGHFTCNDVSTDSFISNDVALGDVNNDGKLDAVFANSDSLISGNGQRNRVCLGNGLGGFACSDVNTDTHISLGVALGYINGDNNLDIVFANGDAFTSGTVQRDRVCLGNGSGGFTCNDVSTTNDVSFGVALGDVNKDGYLDAFFGNSGQRNRICFGDGMGGFSCNDVSPDVRSSNGVDVGFLGFDITTIKVGIPANGEATANLDGTVTYTPSLGFVGSDIFTYSIEGAVATVTIETKPTIYLPVIFK